VLFILGGRDSGLSLYRRIALSTSVWPVDVQFGDDSTRNGAALFFGSVRSWLMGEEGEFA
jgi:hypothetical protein